jgi:CRISPR-associated endonuclease/helicase Cas3
VLDAQADPAFNALTDEVKDLVLHLIAVHHGRARPHFSVDEAFDPERPLSDVEALAVETPRRFARLQRKYGRWGLAYLESLLRAADWAASAAPSEFVTETKEVSR